jgi:hypothetical protein
MEHMGKLLGVLWGQTFEATADRQCGHLVFPPGHKKTRIGRCGFSVILSVLPVLALVAVPHRPRTIIRAQIIAVVIVDGGGQERGHGTDRIPVSATAQLLRWQPIQRLGRCAHR